MKKQKLFILISFLLIFTSCTQRLIDFTMISNKNVSLKFDKTQGKQTKGSSMMVFGIFVNIKDAMDDAFAKAGPGYDLLVDGVVRMHNYLGFWAGYSIEGLAINTNKLKAYIGEKEFENWCKNHNIFDPNKPISIEN